MMTKKTGMFCLNSTFTRQDETNAGPGVCVALGGDLPSAAIIMKVENFDLSDEQSAKIKAIHERAITEIMAALGW